MHPAEPPSQCVRHNFFAARLLPDAGGYFVQSILSVVRGLSRHMPASGLSESARQKTAADSEFKWIRPACDRYWKWISSPVKTNNAFPAQRFAERRPGGDWDGWRIVLSSQWLARCSPGPSTSASLLMHIVHAQATAHTHMQTHKLTWAHKAVNVFKGTERQIKAFFFEGF